LLTIETNPHLLLMPTDQPPSPDWGALLADLYYPSESDEPIEFIAWPPEALPALSPDCLLQHLGLPADTPVREQSPDEFWEPVLRVEDWYEEEEKAVVERFREVQTALTREVAAPRAFRIGEIEIDVYLLGQRPDGSWAGLKTRVVQT